MRWLVDASNVIGSRPDGWWRDRADTTVATSDAALAARARALGARVEGAGAFRRRLASPP